MATIMLLEDNIRVKAAPGTNLRTVALKTGASMPFGCRVGDCSTCVAHVRSGMIHLGEKNEKECRALAMIGGDVSELRLLCQCVVRDEEGEIVISYGL